MQWLPPFLAYGFADLLVPALVVVTYCTRRRATRKRRGFYWNTAVVFREEITGRQRRRLLWRWARHMTHLGIDVARTPLIRTPEVTANCDLTDLEKLQKHFDAGQGILAPSGHLGIYEIMPHLVALHGHTLLSPYRPSPIPIVTDIINELRVTADGAHLTELKGAVRHMLRALQKGEILGLVSDVSSKSSEVFAPFLGTMAATNSTAGVLHIKTGAPVVIASAHRTARQHYKLHIWEVIESYDTGDRRADVKHITERVNACLTQAIVTYPEQWFWDSRRFRNRPADEDLDPDGLPPRVDPAAARAILATL